jgi:hypothetical protein
MEIALYNELKGGEIMPRYGDDECEECGGIRVAKSKLCADCLVKRLDAEMTENLIKRQVIEGLKKEIELLKGMLDDALNYGLKKNQENGRLLARCRELEELMIRRL